MDRYSCIMTLFFKCTNVQMTLLTDLKMGLNPLSTCEILLCVLPPAASRGCEWWARLSLEAPGDCC